MTRFFTTVIKSGKLNPKTAILLEPTYADKQCQASIQQLPTIVTEKESHSIGDFSKTKRPTPVQERLHYEIAVLHKRIASYSEFIVKRNIEVQSEQQKQLKNLQEEKKNKEKLLNKKIIEAMSTKEVWEKKTKALTDLKK